MRLLYRWFSLILALFTVLSVSSLSVYADHTYTEYNGYSFTAEGDATVDYSTYFDDAKVDETGKLLWTFLKTNGFNDIAIAAVIGNFQAESGLDYSASEGGTSAGENGRGIAQWTTCSGGLGTECHAALAKFALENHGHKDITPSPGDSIDNTWLSCLECQIKFFVTDPSYGNKKMSALGYDRHTPCPESDFYLEDYAKYDWLGKNNNDVDKALQHAVEVFCFHWEVPSDYYAHLARRRAVAKAAFDKYSGMKIDATNGTVTGSDGSVMNITGDMGWVLDESAFVTTNSLDESAIQFMSASDLEYNDRTELRNWKSTIDLNKQDNYYHIPRTVFMFIGIIIVIYSVVLYLAFQFDKVNNFIDIELLNMFTLGRLRASVDETSNYADHSAKNKVVKHKDMIKISLVGIVIGVLLISGKLFNTLYEFIMWLKGIL